MMEQFLYGLFMDAKYHLLKSPGVLALLSDQNFHDLRTRNYSKGDPFWLDTERVVAIQYITTVTYDEGLHGIWNHTLLFPIREYISLTYPPQRFAKYFIRCEADAPPKLETITIEE